MSHRTAAFALLLFSSYGIALPQVIPFLSTPEFAPVVTPTPLPLAASVNATIVTVVGTIVQDAVESAVESFTDVLEDAAESVTSALESATDAIEDVLPTSAPEVLDPEANILPLILPGILPVETDLPPVDDETDETPPIFLPDDGTTSVDGPEPEASILPALDDLPDTNSLEVIDLPPPNVTLSDDDFPDGVDLEVIELPAPNVTLPEGLPAPDILLPGEDIPTPDVLLPGDDLPAPDILLPGEDIPTPDVLLPDESLPVPSETPSLVSPGFPLVPDFPDFPDEASVPISTFNAVVQPLLSVIQTLLNSLPGNAAPPLPDILVNPIRPTGPPDIFIDPILPTDTLDDVIPAPTDVLDELIDPLFDLLVAPIPSPLDINATDIPFAQRFAKRQVPGPLTQQGIFDLIISILQSINALVQAIPVVGPNVADIVDDVADSVLPPVDLPIYDLPVPQSPRPVNDDSVPPVPLPSPINVEFPDEDVPPVPLPSPIDVEFPDVDDAPVPLPSPIDVSFPDVLDDVPATDLPEPIDVETPGAPVDVPPFPASNDSLPSIPPTPVDPVSTISDEALNVPTDDVEAIDWSAFESPPFSPLPEPEAPVEAVPAVPAIIAITSAEAISAVASVVADAPAPLPTSLDALGDFDLPAEFTEVLPDWPFTEIPDTVTPDANGELPDLNDITIPFDVLNVPVPDLPTESVAGLLLPVEAPTLALPTEFIAAVPTSPFDIPVPDDFEDLPDLPEVTAVASILPAAPVIDDFDFSGFPAEFWNLPVPDLDENGIPIDIPTAPTAVLPAAPAALPTDLNWWDIPVPDDFVDEDLPAVEAPVVNAPAALPTDLSFLDIPVPDDFEDLNEEFVEVPAPIATPSPAVSLPVIPDDVLNVPVPDLDDDGLPIEAPAPATEAAAPALPVEAFGAGSPIEVLPDVPLVLPTGDLLPVEGAAGLTVAVSAVPTDAISGLPTEVAADPVAFATTIAVNLAPVAAPSVAAPVAVETPPALPPVAVPATPAVVPRLPFQVPGSPRPVEKRQTLASLFRPRPIVPRPVPTLPANVPAVQIIKPVFDLISTLLAKLGVDAEKVPNLAAALSLAPVLPPVPAIPGVPTVSQITEIVESVASVANSVASTLPDVADIASILPAPVVPSILPVPLVLPPLEEVASILSPPAIPSVVPVPLVLPPLEEVSSVLPAVVSLPTQLTTAALLPVVPTRAIPDVPLASAVGGTRRARRAIEESDLESFLGELDESHQSELTGLIHDFATAVNNDVDAVADTLRSDLEGLSDDTKAQLVSGFASTFGKRDMRHGKRQKPPGAASIGPNLDDARKVDFSSVLGLAGSLDPYGQASQNPYSPYAGSPVDGPRPAGFHPQHSSFGQLPDSSVTASSDAELAAIIAAGGLDPNGMRDPAVTGDLADDSVIPDPYGGIRPPWDSALDVSRPAQALEGLEETLQASRGNHIGSKTPRVPFRNTPVVSNAPSSVLNAAQDATQRSVLLWFHRFVKPSWNKDVDAKIDFT